MSIRVTPIPGSFAATVEGFDIAAGVASSVIAEVRRALDRQAVLVLPNQAMDDEQQVAFSRQFGPLEQDLRRRAEKRRIENTAVFDLSNLDPDGNLLDPSARRAKTNRGNQRWHSDSSFKPVPAMASMLSGRAVPPAGAGGETEFADMRAAFDALPEERKAFLRGRVTEHSIVYSQNQLGVDGENSYAVDLPPVQQALVRRHPASGRETLYLGSHAARVLGMPEAEGRALLDELLEFATQPRFVYSHVWRTNDLVIWDNRSVLHRGRPWDETKHARDMHRTTVAGAGPTAMDGRPVEERDVVAA